MDFEQVIDWIMTQAKLYRILGIALDTFRYSLLKNAFEKNGIFPHDKQHPDGVIYLVRNGSVNHNKVAPVIDDMFARHNVIFGDDPMMRWYANNTAVKLDGKGNKTYEKIEPLLRKNDGFMALVHVMSIDDLLIEKKNSGRILDVITF